MTADQIESYIAIAGGVVALASAIAAVTPTDSDNRIVAAFTRVLDAFALNWGKRNPRSVEKDAVSKTGGDPTKLHQPK